MIDFAFIINKLGHEQVHFELTVLIRFVWDLHSANIETNIKILNK